MPQVADKPKSKSKLTYSKQTYINWYRIMKLIRRFEEQTLVAYSQQKIRGFCHVYIGQEAIAAGIVSALRKSDPIVTAYRQHGIALCRDIEAKYCMAELYGKATGVVKGKGGSMHFFSKENNYFGGNGIVGAQIPIGTGIAFAEKYRETDNLCVTMFGDGAARQGALYESFNMAMTWKLPVLFLCENNGYAMGTSVKRTSNITEIFKVGAAFNIPSDQIDGMDAESVHEGLERAAKYIRAGHGPYFLEIKTYRSKGHSVSDPAKYRTTEELEHYKNLDPIERLREKTLSAGLISESEFSSLDVEVEGIIDEALRFAEESPFPDPSELYTDNYLQKDYPFIKD